MMKTALADDRGRITLGTSALDRYGRKFAVINAEKEIVLIPIARNPLAKLARIGEKARIDGYTLKQLRKIARTEAEKEIFGTKNVCRH